MIYRSRAPFRIGLAGGGTDVSPYSDEYGGAILNATISLYAYTTIIPRTDGKIIIRAVDRGEELIFDSSDELPVTGTLDLQVGVYNRIVKEFGKKGLSFEMITSMDVSSGSGLGTSSTLVTSILGAFVEWFKLPLGEYDIAQLAYDIERVDLAMAGGKQDQYAATFGGVNFMEFYEGNKVIVNPLRIKAELLNELQFNLILYYTDTSRESAKIIETQVGNAKAKKDKPVQAMHAVKEQAFLMKEALLKDELHKIGEILSVSWENKKKMAAGITNELIDDIYSTAIEAGATGGKISGAGGGGFMIFYAEEANRYNVIKALGKFGGQAKRYEFSKEGLTTWTVS
jgi:D-glycero-alpha-D-manno-heptose-7-phosphate kinase|tara:strand:+ start:230 stop:1255 length:1026 start_codon:yes stop_codon:yes gene_type:complete